MPWCKVFSRRDRIWDGIENSRRKETKRWGQRFGKKFKVALLHDIGIKRVGNMY